MEYEKIKQLIDDMGNSKLTDIDITFPDGTKISMKKEAKQETIIVNQEVKEINTNNQPIHIETKKELEGNIIKSPMVGTFYQAPNPESPVFVKVGDKVGEETIVCIVEAMKLFNEIEAEIKGEIVEVLVKDGQLVEYGQPLFLVKPE